MWKICKSSFSEIDLWIFFQFLDTFFIPALFHLAKLNSNISKLQSSRQQSDDSRFTTGERFLSARPVDRKHPGRLT